MRRTFFFLFGEAARAAHRNGHPGRQVGVGNVGRTHAPDENVAPSRTARSLGPNYSFRPSRNYCSSSVQREAAVHDQANKIPPSEGVQPRRTNPLVFLQFRVGLDLHHPAVYCSILFP
jgi:hypothetical protein